MKFFNILYINIIILFIFSILNFTYSNESFNFQCVVDIITKNGSHTISTASIISSEYLVTSASSVAVDGLKSLIITCCDENSFLIKAKTNNIIIHPKYQPDKGLNDVALIKVPKKKLKSDCIKPIALPCNFEDEYLERKAALTSIWITDINDELPKTRIVQPDLPFSGLCYKYLHILYKYPYNEQNMCIRLNYYNGTKCSPSHPIVIKNCQNENTLAGFTVYSPSECTHPIAGVKLSQFYEWIQSVTKNKIPECTRCDCDDVEYLSGTCGFNDSMFYFLTMD